jgi:citrate synthase
VQNILRNKERVMGFGHRVYKTSADPRIELMKEFCKKHGSSSDKGQKMQNLAEHIEKVG